jgi:hypothetical protein
MANIILTRPRSVAAYASNGAGMSKTPASNLGTVQPSQVARTTTLTALQLDFDRGATATESWDQVVLAFHNLSPAATASWARATSQANLATAAGNDAIASASVWRPSGRPSSDDYPLLVADSRYRGMTTIVRFPTATAMRWGRVTVADAGNTNAFLEFGRLFPGLAIQPGRNFGFGWQIAGRDGSLRVRAEHGAAHFASGPEWRIVKLPLKWLRQQPPTAQDWQAIYETLRWVRGASDLAVQADPDADRDWHLKTVVGVPVEARDFEQGFLGHFAGILTVEELI